MSSSSSPTPLSSPAKPPPLHNFELPAELKWNKAGQPSFLQKRRRSSIKPPSQQRPMSASPAPSSPSQESVSVTPPPAQSPLKDAAAPLQSRDVSMKDSPARGESSKASPDQAELKDGAAGGDELGKVLSTLIREESHRHSQKRDTTTPDSESLKKGKGVVIEYRRNHSKSLKIGGLAFSSLKIGGNSDPIKKKVEKKSKPEEKHESANKNPKITIKIAKKNSKEEKEEKNSKLGLLKTPIPDEPGKSKSEEPGKSDEPGKSKKEEPGKSDVRGKSKMEEEPREEEATKAKDGVDEEARVFDLRPRKPKSKSKAQKGTTIAAEKGSTSKLPEKSTQKAKEAKSSKEKKEKGEKSEKEKKKLTLNISLTKQEIEEDIFALTGGKPARRPKKRPKNVQKQLDLVFPGQWLVSITPETYKVSESSVKG